MNTMSERDVWKGELGTATTGNPTTPSKSYPVHMRKTGRRAGETPVLVRPIF